jgi:asparagine synthase (glutamine-hydrolysing)
MCGIIGFNWPDKNLVEKMAETIRHRGPDDMGSFVDENVSLAHRRLSVIDISENGHQPMSFDHLVISYNGEIYNFKEIRAQLASKGYSFISETDTEVVLKSYHCWGDSCVEKFNGMWAFCIYDKKAGRLFLSRDRFGIKPLYYYFDGDGFIFASELKAIREHKLKEKINIAALNWFFCQKYIGDKHSIYENCYKLKPSENLVFDLTQKTVSVKKYFHLEEEVSRYSRESVAERVSAVENILADAVSKRLMADVPVGAFLSGGLDSSIISAIIAAAKDDFDTFSIGFKQKTFDEVPFSKIVSRHIGTNHHVEYLDIDEQLIENIVSRMDEPFGDASVIPTYLLSRMTRKSVTVSLSGDAGDEVFGGYDTYKAYKLAQYLPRSLVSLSRPLLNLLPPSDRKLSLSFKMQKFAQSTNANVCQRHFDWMATFSDDSRRELLGDNCINADSLLDFSKEKNLLAVQLNDIHNYLSEDILKKVDLASMLNSLEVRVPFLDHRLVPLVLSLPEKYKIRYLRTKWLLKRIASNSLPGEITHRTKRGFTVPVSRWIKDSELMKEFITSGTYYEHGLLNYDYVHRLFDDHVNNRMDNTRLLWLVFVFNNWWYNNG